MSGKQIPEAVRAWLNAEGKFREAVETYNARVALVRAERERGNWPGGSIDPEYQAMEEARRASAASLRVMYDALTAAQQQGQAVACCTMIDYFNARACDSCSKSVEAIAFKNTAPPPSVPEGWVLVEQHWAQNIWYASRVLESSEVKIDRLMGKSLANLALQIDAAPALATQHQEPKS